MQDILSQLPPDRPYFSHSVFGIQGVPRRHQHLSRMIHSLKGQRIKLLEIGSWIGASALTFGFSMREFDVTGEILCVDPWLPYFADKDVARGSVYAGMDKLSSSDIAYKLFLHNIQFSPITIQHRRGLSSDILPTLESNSFDVIYIDGSHYYDDVNFDLRESDRLLKVGGILCGDDLELQVSDGIDFEFAVENDARDFLKDPKLGQPYHPGVTLAVNDFFPGSVSSYDGFWIMKKIAPEQYEQYSLEKFDHIIPPHFAKECTE